MANNTIGAGRELDRRVEWFIFGNSVYEGQGGWCFSPHDARTGITRDVCLPVPRYSTDLSAAYKVVEALARKYFTLWCSGNGAQFAPTGIRPADGQYSEAEDGNLAHAICIAALITVRRHGLARAGRGDSLVTAESSLPSSPTSS